MLFLTIGSSHLLTNNPQEIYDNLNKSASVYYAYPQVDEQYTPAPAGYTPFIYHIMAVTVRAILLPILIIYR